MKAMKRTIERPKPPYAQVADALRSEIFDGTLPAGEPIPSERQIAEDWGVSRATATKAVAMLKSQGLVEAEVGVGTMVRDPSAKRGPRERQNRMVEGRRVRTDTETSAFDMGIVTAPAEVRTALRLDDGDDAIFRSRVTSDKGVVVEVSTSWFDAALASSCPDLLVDKSIEQGTTAYVAEQLGVHIGTHTHDVRAELATPEDAEHYGLDLPSPMLVVDVTAFDEHGDPLAFETYRYPPTHRSVYPNLT